MATPYASGIHTGKASGTVAHNIRTHFASATPAEWHATYRPLRQCHTRRCVPQCHTRRELDDKQLDDIYRTRSGIEWWFRSLKQTFGRRTLRSRDAGHARCELDWSIVGLGLIHLQGVQALEAAGQDAHCMSEAEAILVVRGTILHADFSLECLPTLTAKLQRAVLDTYQRTRPKQGRHIHRKRKHDTPGEPRIVDATPEQQSLACQLQAAQSAA